MFGVEGVENVDEEFLEAGFSEEFQRLFRASGVEGVVMIPEVIGEFQEGLGKLREGRFLAGQDGEGFPLAGGGGEGGEASLGMISRTGGAG